MRAVTRRAGIAGISGLALIASALAIIPVAGAQAAPGPRFGENSLLPPQMAARGRDVAGLAVNPADPNHIVEAEADPVNLQCDYNVSFDGGRTWTGGHLTVRRGGEDPPFPSPACDQNFDSGGYLHFNTGVVFGSGQNVYITFSVHRGGFNRPESNEDAGAGDEAVVARSTDGGRTFEPAVAAVPGGGPVLPDQRGLAGRGMRPQIAVQRGAGTGGQDRLYVSTWNCYIRVRASQTSRGGCSGGGGDRRLFVVRSDDGGATWTAPVLASEVNVRAGGAPSPTPATPCVAGTACAEAGSPDEQLVEPSQPVVGPDGAVYVAYKNRDITDGTTCPVNPDISGTAPGGFTRTKAFCVVVTRSTDQGQTWQQFNTGQPVNPATLIHPRLAIDPTTGPTGSLYVVYQRRARGTGPSADPSDITFQSSSDGAQTWSAAVLVNDDPAGPDPLKQVGIQTNPNVSVSPGGVVNVIWSDRRHAYPGAGSYGDIYYARSTNGGASFAPNRRVTDRTINLDVGRYGDVGSAMTPGGSWYGPVILPLPDGRVVGAWTDSRLGNTETGFQDILLSRLDPGAGLGSSAITTATGPGLSVLLSRLAYPGGTEGIGPRGGEPFTRLVVANEGDVAGALAGAVLARSRMGSLLLSPAGGLPAVVKAEAARMAPEGAYVVGDGGSLSSAVASDVRDTTRGGENVTRVAAPSNVATRDRPAELGRRVAELLVPLPGSSPEAVIANPGTPEAASAAALAAALKLPILFVDNRTPASVPAPTTAAITSLGIKKALIVGGTTSVSAGIEGALTTSLGAGNVERVGGADQYATSDAVVTEARSRGLPSNVVYVADGTRPMDAAVVGAAVARLGGLLLLAPSASTAAAETRLGALGVDAAVDRLVAAVGTGGTDPAPPATPTSTPTPTPTATPTPAPPGRGAVPIVGKDTAAPLVALSGKTAQSIKLGYLSVVVQSNEAATFSLSGTVARPALRATSRASAAARAEKAKTFKLPTVRTSTRAGQRRTVRLRLSKKTIKAVNQGLARGRRSTARITVVGFDAAGNKRTVKRQIRITK